MSNTIQRACTTRQVQHNQDVLALIGFTEPQSHDQTALSDNGGYQFHESTQGFPHLATWMFTIQKGDAWFLGIALILELESKKFQYWYIVLWTQFYCHDPSNVVIWHFCITVLPPKQRFHMHILGNTLDQYQSIFDHKHVLFYRQQNDKK